MRLSNLKKSTSKKRSKPHVEEAPNLNSKKSNKILADRLNNSTATAPQSTNSSFNANFLIASPYTRGVSPEALSLEAKLTDKLKKLSVAESDTVLTSAKFLVIKDIFDEVISRDVLFGSLLLKIRDFYDI